MTSPKDFLLQWDKEREDERKEERQSAKEIRNILKLIALQHNGEIKGERK